MLSAVLESQDASCYLQFVLLSVFLLEDWF